MMKSFFLKLSLIILLFSLVGTGCVKDYKNELQHVNMILHDKPLSVIQSYTTGNWKLQYIYGGISVHKVIDTYNSYMILNPDHITIGNDLYGVVVDTTIVWVKDEIEIGDTTYILSYTRLGYASPECFIVDQIKEDTLIISDYNISDGFNYYYTKY